MGANLPPVMRLLWSASPLSFVLQLLLYLVQAFTPALSIYLNRSLLDRVTQIVQGDRAALPAAVWLTLAMSGAMLLSILALTASRHVERRLFEHLSQRVEGLIIEKAQKLPLSFFDLSESYNQLQRARSNFAQRGLAMSSSALRTGTSLLTLCSYLSLLALGHVLLPVVLAPIFAFALYLNLRWGRQRFLLSYEQTARQREMEYVGQLLYGSAPAKEVRLFGLGPYLSERWSRQASVVRDQNLALDGRQSLAELTVNGFAFLTTAAATLWLLFQVVEAKLTLGTYVAVGSAIFSTLNLIPQIANTLRQLTENALHTGEMFRFLALPEEEAHGTARLSEPIQEVRVENLAFCYPDTPGPTLQDISFTIRAGETIAIVGENGAGKTTLAKCLLGLYLPTAGTIRYNGLDLREMDRKHLTEQVTAVFQDFMQYALTLRENVGLGRPALLHDDAALEAAAAMSGAVDIVRSMPKAWDTRLGRMWTDGRELSKGQWQSVALARGLFRDAQLIILDEPTAALDPKAEAAILSHFAQVVTGRTSIIISHRLGMARMADRILVLRGGKLIETGNHEDLLARDGEYARMFRAQSQWYTDQPSLRVVAGETAR